MFIACVLSICGRIAMRPYQISHKGTLLEIL
jgi:hypothetical protein